MAKTATNRSKAPAMPVPQSREETDAAIREIGSLQRTLAQMDASFGERIAAVKEAHERKAAGDKQRLKGLEKAVQTYCEAHKNELTRDGKRRSFKFAAGLVRWRKTPAKVTIRGVEKVLEYLKGLRNGGKFVRTKWEINKEALLEDPKFCAKTTGITIAGGEQFEIEPFDAKLDGEAA